MKSLSELDFELGMYEYSTETLPCGARARKTDEDFAVEEATSLEQMTAEPMTGYLPVYRVEKRSIDTFHMERELSDALGSRISYGGLKDSRAVAVQYVTPTSSRSNWPRNVTRRGFTASLIGYLPGPLSRGAVLGNMFRITLRDCCPFVEEAASGVLESATLKKIPNFFGYQRFGVEGAGTHRIGEAIVKKRFGEAVDLLLTVPSMEGGPAIQEAREEMARGNWGRAHELLPPTKDLERMVTAHLAEDPNDKIRALRGIPVKVRRLYVQAYQSFIFNRAISLAVAQGLDISLARRGDNWGEVVDGAVAPKVESAREAPPAGASPMVQLAGYAYRDYGSRFDGLTTKVMSEEAVGAKDFYVKEMQEVSAEGGFRIAHLVLSDQRFTVSEETAVLSFRLARGQYATMILREIIKPADPRESGLV